MNKIRDEKCQNCNRFSHCNNNELVCISKYRIKYQECERLKKQYNCNACGTCNGKEDYKNMQRHCEKAIAQNHNYKQALNEIETYQKRNCETCVFANTPKCNVSCQIFVILDIINKKEQK